MVDVIISFDSEDYLTPEAADAERWWAEALQQRGLRGSFQLVGEMIRSLHRRGRSDVIDAIAAHEVGFHSNFHSAPPTHPPTVDGLPLDAAIAHILRSEAPGMAEIAATFSRWPISYCSPGDSWTPATLLAMSRMGVRVFCNDVIRHTSGLPYWYCGLLVASYDLDFQDYFEDETYRPGAFEATFAALEARTPADGVIVLYTHPTRLVTAEFWDAVFFGGKRPDLATCPAAPLRPADQIARQQQRCAGWLDWLRQRPGLRFIDFATLYEERAGSRRDIDDLLAETGLAPGQEGGLPLRTSPADAFLPSAVVASRDYHWPIYPPGFTGQRLINQAGQLAWTAAPANRRAS